MTIPTPHPLTADELNTMRRFRAELIEMTENEHVIMYPRLVAQYRATITNVEHWMALGWNNP